MGAVQGRARKLGGCLLAIGAFLVVGLFVAASGEADEAADVAAVPVLDELKRSENPLSAGGSWAALQWTTGNQTGAVTPEGWRALDAHPAINGAYWTPSQFSGEGNGDAVAVTMAAGPASQGKHIALWLNMPNPAKAKSGYQLSWSAEAETTEYEVALAKYTSGTKTLLDSESGVPIPSGTTLALSYNDGLITAWSGTGASLSSLASASDSTYPSGYLGLEASGNLSRSAGFRGGELAPEPVAECSAGSRLFGGACWKESAAATKVGAPQAAAICAAEGGALPSTLALTAFAKAPGIALAAEGEWTDETTNYSGPGIYAVMTVNTSAEVVSALPTATRTYRCVYPVGS